MQEWRNWQTRRLQVPVAAMSCGFKSHLLHLFYLIPCARSDAQGFFYFSFECYYSQPPHMRIRRLFEAPVSLLTELRLLMWVEFLLRRLDMDVQSSSYMQA